MKKYFKVHNPRVVLVRYLNHDVRNYKGFEMIRNVVDEDGERVKGIAKQEILIDDRHVEHY